MMMIISYYWIYDGHGDGRGGCGSVRISADQCEPSPRPSPRPLPRLSPRAPARFHVPIIIILSTEGHIRPTEGTSVPQRAHLSRRGHTCPTEGTSVPQRAHLSRRGHICPTEGTSVPQRAHPSHRGHLHTIWTSSVICPHSKHFTHDMDFVRYFPTLKQFAHR